MESPYESDMSDDTRDLVEQGLAINRRKYSSRAEYRTDDHGQAPNRDMDISSVCLLPAFGAILGEPSARGLNLTGVENVGGQKRNKLQVNETGRGAFVKAVLGQGEAGSTR